MDTSYILNINSTATICSVALSNGEQLIGLKETTKVNSHTEVITLFIQALMREHRLQYSELAAVAIAAGPGSYTSLRVGCATAKGICFAMDIPLIAIPSLDILAFSCIPNAHKGDMIIPMIDARRMEVYTAVYDYHGSKLVEDHAHILCENSFSDFVDANIYHRYAGNGAEKAMPVLNQSQQSVRYEHYSSAKFMPSLAYKALQKKDFVDIAYYEPFYLKPAAVTKSKKKYF